MARAIRVPPGTIPKDADFDAGTRYPTVGEAVQAEDGILDGLDPWIKGDGIYAGPIEIRQLRGTMDRMKIQGA